MLDLQCEGQACEGCQEVIADRYFLHVNGACWHTDCLRCCVCCSSLEQEESCFVKDENIYCRRDYIRYVETPATVLSVSFLNNSPKEQLVLNYIPNLFYIGFAFFTSRLSQWSVRIIYYIMLFFFYLVVNLEPSVQNVTERYKRQTGSGGHVKMCITWRVLHATPVSDSSPPGKSSHWAGTNCYVCGTTRLLLKETRIKVRAFLISFLLIFIFYFF